MSYGRHANEDEYSGEGGTGGRFGLGGCGPLWHVSNLAHSIANILKYSRIFARGCQGLEAPGDGSGWHGLSIFMISAKRKIFANFNRSFLRIS